MVTDTQGTTGDPGESQQKEVEPAVSDVVTTLFPQGRNPDYRALSGKNIGFCKVVGFESWSHMEV